MSAQLNPYLSFGGDAADAMAFYAGVFGGTPEIMTYGQAGVPDPAMADKVMHASLRTPSGLALMASDTAPGMPHSAGSSITVSLSGDDGELLRGYWAELSDGGTVTMALERQMWGDDFGMCTDRFGVPWMVNIAGGA